MSAYRGLCVGFVLLLGVGCVEGGEVDRGWQSESRDAPRRIGSGGSGLSWSFGGSGSGSGSGGGGAGENVESRRVVGGDLALVVAGATRAAVEGILGEPVAWWSTGVGGVAAVYGYEEDDGGERRSRGTLQFLGRTISLGGSRAEVRTALVVYGLGHVVCRVERLEIAPDDSSAISAVRLAAPACP